MSNKAATIGDIGTDHDGFPPTPIITGSQDIIIDYKPAARVGDALAPHAKPKSSPHARTITTGSSTVFFNGKPARVRSRMFYERKQFIEHSVIGGNLNIHRSLFPSTWVRNEELVK